MPAKSFVSPLDWENMTPAERQFATLYGLEALDRAIKQGSAKGPLASPPNRPSQAFNIIGKEQKDLEGHKIVTG